MGLRIDKRITEVKKEEEMATQKIKNTKVKNQEEEVSKQSSFSSRKSQPGKKKATGSPVKKIKNEKEWLNKDEENKIVKLNSHDLKLTNLDKVYWKKENYTKRDLLNYYFAIAPHMLPYMKDRPQSLNRHPNGINGMSFYQKNVEGKVPDWTETFEEFSESTNENVHYFVCTNEASLIYMANLGCIEMNPWHSTTKKPDNPTWCVIDLDPGNISFEKVIETALVIKDLADDLEIDTYCKTSGSTGLHIYIPLGAAYDYDQSRQLAELLVTLVHKEIPSFTSLERSPAKRKTKIYLDYLQNRSIQTIAAPYSLRPKPGATASAPLHWEEVKKGLSIQDFTIENMHSRANEVGDIFKQVLGKGINLKKVLAKISELQNE
jgi:bifunctional non-homologous end joining protein LigD